MNPVRHLYRKLSVNVFLLVMVPMRHDCINNLVVILLGTVMYTDAFPVQLYSHYGVVECRCITYSS